MHLTIQSAAVLGAGVMGAQIAALLAAAGVRTHLLDLVSDQPPVDPGQRALVGDRYRSAAAILAVDRLRTLRPPPLASESVLQRLIPGNYADDLAALADVDWVIEAVVERLDVKQELLSRVGAVVGKHVPITTNTSGLTITRISEGLPGELQARFFGTHFFNPPRAMRLVELIPGEHTDLEGMHALGEWIEARLGKGVVQAADRVNFIGNRIGIFNLMAGLRQMQALGLEVEAVDALTGPLVGRPASATLRTIDVIGLDTFAHVAANVYHGAPEDPWRDWFLPPAWLQDLIGRGHLGQKAVGRGIYCKTRTEAGETRIQAWRPEAGAYTDLRPEPVPWLQTALAERDIGARLRQIVDREDVHGRYVWTVLRDTLAYAAHRVEEIADGDLLAVDRSLRWGFNWQLGPFELWQALGHNRVLARMREEGVRLPAWLAPGQVFYQPAPGSADWRGSGPAIAYNASDRAERLLPRPSHRQPLPLQPPVADPRTVCGSEVGTLLDLGDDVACLALHVKMNAIDQRMVDLLNQSLELVADGFAGLVIASDGPLFSAGADLKRFLAAIQAGRFADIDRFIAELQQAFGALVTAPFPSVACPQGLTLGGGCELSLHATRQLLAGETYAGLVEPAVGLLPAGGGTTALALRAYAPAQRVPDVDPLPFLRQAFQLIGSARRSGSGLEAIEMGLYPESASVTWSRDRQVDLARRWVLEMAGRGHVPPLSGTTIVVPGRRGIEALMAPMQDALASGAVSAHDSRIAEWIATIVCGGDVPPGTPVPLQRFLDLERQGFVELCRTSATAARIEHMLSTGRPLRN